MAIVGAWFETLGVSALALLGILIGAALSKFRKPYCWFGLGVSFLLVFILVIIRFFPGVSFAAPFSWLAVGRTRFVVIAVAVTLGLTSSVRHLRFRFEKVTVCILMAIVVVWFCISPFLAPAIVEKDLSALNNNTDSSGICYQSRDYTCGPAAAVTALAHLGLEANEGEIAVLAHSSPVTGTLPDCLRDALLALYEDKGLKCQYRRFDSLSELQDYPVTLAVVKDAFLADHCVAVMNITDDAVTIADPADGMKTIPRERFEKVWRYCGVVLKRDLISASIQ
jgi:predicted double-glycine peptidase